MDADRQRLVAGSAAGYLVLALVGVFLLTLDIGGGTVSPDLLPAVALAMIVYPALCGGVGGAIAGLAPS